MDKSTGLRQGINTLIGLAVLTGIEFWASYYDVQNGMFVIVVIGITKAILILSSFMHIGKLFESNDKGGHE